MDALPSLTEIASWGINGSTIRVVLSKTSTDVKIQAFLASRERKKMYLIEDLDNSPPHLCGIPKEIKAALLSADPVPALKNFFSTVYPTTTYVKVSDTWFLEFRAKKEKEKEAIPPTIPPAPTSEFVPPDVPQRKRGSTVGLLEEVGLFLGEKSDLKVPEEAKKASTSPKSTPPLATQDSNATEDESTVFRPYDGEIPVILQNPKESKKSCLIM